MPDPFYYIVIPIMVVMMIDGIGKNAVLATDSYKLTHHAMYPPGTRFVGSYLESRAGGECDYTVFFGLQYVLDEYLSGVRVTEEAILEAM